MKKLFEAKKEIPVIKKDATNPFFKSGYATLSNIIEVVDPILAKHELYIYHNLQLVGDDSILATSIVDKEQGNGGITSFFKLPPNTDIQKIGSAITYAKRYNITALLNSNIEDDDDGNATKTAPSTAPPKAPSKPEPISKECKAYIDYISNATSKKQLADIATAIASEPKLTKNDKSHLREIYNQKEKEVK